MCSIANKHIAHHPSFSVIMNTCGKLENLRPETPRPLLKKKKIEKIKNSRFIEEFVTRYKSFRDFKIGEKDSDHLKAMLAETNSEGLLLGIAIFVPRGRRFFWSKAEWLRGRE